MTWLAQAGGLATVGIALVVVADHHGHGLSNEAQRRKGQQTGLENAVRRMRFARALHTHRDEAERVRDIEVELTLSAIAAFPSAYAMAKQPELYGWRSAIHARIERRSWRLRRASGVWHEEPPQRRRLVGREALSQRSALADRRLGLLLCSNLLGERHLRPRRVVDTRLCCGRQRWRQWWRRRRRLLREAL